MNVEPFDRTFREPAPAMRLSCASEPAGTGGSGGSARVRVPPVKVFTEEALSRLSESDEPPTAAEAELSGPWRVIPLEEGFGVIQMGDEDAGDPPLGRFASRHLALLAAAALPGLGRGSGYRVEGTTGEDGYALWREGIDVGALRVFLADLAPALEVLETLLRSPMSLALLLEAAGPTALERAGRVLGQRLAAGGAEGRE